jgi:ribosomal protein S18 acetylase RimI-like enzyme
MTIRKATIADAEKLIPMWVKLMEYHSEQNMIFKAAPDFKEKVGSDIQRFLENPSIAIFVAEQGDALVGFSMVSVSKRADVFALGKKGHIGETFVDDSFRSQGVGTHLIAAVKEWFKNQSVDFIDLQVTKTNETGRKFWEKNGFKITNYYMLNDMKE